jgi:hypothetical protein
MNCHFLVLEFKLVNIEITSSLKLDHVTFLDISHVAFSNCSVRNVAVFVYNILNLLIFLNLLFGNQMIKLDKSNFEICLFINSDPSKFLSSFEIFILNGQVSVKFNSSIWSFFSLIPNRRSQKGDDT